MRAMTKTFMTKMCGLAQTARIHNVLKKI